MEYNPSKVSSHYFSDSYCYYSLNNSEKRPNYKIGEFSKIARVTTRQLGYYDEWWQA